MQGKRAWVAFEGCSLASIVGDQKKSKRFFEIGYTQGKEFVEAYKAGKIKKEDLSSEVPVIVLLLLEGPSNDFILGRFFENAQREALKDIYQKAETDEGRKLRAEDALFRGNYDLLLDK